MSLVYCPIDFTSITLDSKNLITFPITHFYFFTLLRKTTFLNLTFLISYTPCLLSYIPPLSTQHHSSTDLVQCTHEPNVSIPHLAGLLLERSQNFSWVSVFKALLTSHSLMNHGNEVGVLRDWVGKGGSKV